MKKEKTISLGGREISYTFKKVRRSRHIKISVSADSGVQLTSPFYVSAKMADTYLQEKADWVLAQLEKVKNKPTSKLPKATREDYLKYKELAREIAEKKLKRFNAHYGFKWKRISIRNTKSRWGSCSSNKNLNFSYRIIYLPEHLSDYIIIHELCHLGQFNHSKKFWALVEKACPDYKKSRREIREM